jgi:hypothetical protein
LVIISTVSTAEVILPHENLFILKTDFWSTRRNRRISNGTYVLD